MFTPVLINLKIDQIHEFSKNEFAKINKLSMRQVF